MKTYSNSRESGPRPPRGGRGGRISLRPSEREVFYYIPSFNFDTYFFVKKITHLPFLSIPFEFLIKVHYAPRSCFPSSTPPPPHSPVPLLPLLSHLISLTTKIKYQFPHAMSPNPNRQGSILVHQRAQHQ